jgi:hypothetical protein
LLFSLRFFITGWKLAVNESGNYYTDGKHTYTFV